MPNRTTASVFAALLCAAVPARAALTPQPASLSFPDTGTGATSAAKQVMLTNTGNNPLIINNIATTGANAGEFLLGNLPPFPVAINPGVGFPIDVTFAPTGIGQRTANVTVTIANDNPLDVPVSGKGLGPVATVTPSPITVGGKLFGQPQPPVTVTVTNTGGAQLNVTAVTLSGPDAARFSMSGLPGFPKALGPGMSFAFTLTFNPTQAGKATATLTVVSNDPTNPNLGVPVSGLAGNPVISLDTGTVIFGNVRVMQTSPPVNVTITNTGFSDLKVSNISLSGTNAGDFALGNLPNLPQTLAIGATAKFSVTFTPSQAGARSAQVVIANDDPNAPMKALPLSGVGTLPMAAVSPNMLDFGQVKVLSTGGSNFTITNTGTGPVVIKTMMITGPNAALFSVAKQAPFTVAAMSTSVVQVSFKPVAIGMFSATLNLTTDDGNLPAVAIPMTGAGVSPVASVVPMNINFGSVTVGETATPEKVTISNTGNQPLTISTFMHGGDNPGDFPLSNAPIPPFTIAPGKNVPFTIGFIPSIDGLRRARITMATNDPSRLMMFVNIDGFGTQPGVSVSPPMLTFGPVDVGQTAGPQQVTVQNIGDSDLHVSAVTLSGSGAGAFTADPIDPMTVAANKAYKINVTFNPKMAGMFNATLEIDCSDSGIAPSVVMLSGSAAATSISASPVTLDFDAIVVGMTAAPQQVMVRNGGTRLQVLDRITSTDPQFGPPIDNLATPIPPNTSIQLPITFTPKMTGEFKGQVQFWLASSTVPSAAVVVQGSGVAEGGMRDEGSCTVAGHAPAVPSLAMLLALIGWAALLRRRRG